MATSAIIAHRTPGRVRLVVNGKRGDADYFAALSRSLESFPNVQSTRVNPMTGSVALNFIGDLADILRQLDQHDLLSVMESASLAREMQARSAEPPLDLAIGRNINRFFVMGMVLTGICIFQVLKGDLFPPALAVFWFANDAFREAAKSH